MLHIPVNEHVNLFIFKRSEFGKIQQQTKCTHGSDLALFILFLLVLSIFFCVWAESNTSVLWGNACLHMKFDNS